MTYFTCVYVAYMIANYNYVSTCMYTECQLALYKNTTMNHKSTLLVYMLLTEDLILRDTNQQKNAYVNASLCQIVSLEVYRGLNNSIEISHSGFSLTDNSSIKVKLHKYTCVPLK